MNENLRAFRAAFTDDEWREYLSGLPERRRVLLEKARATLDAPEVLTGVQLEDRERPLFEQAIKKSPSHHQRDLARLPWGYKNNAVQHLWEGWILNVKFREGRQP